MKEAEELARLVSKVNGPQHPAQIALWQAADLRAAGHAVRIMWDEKNDVWSLDVRPLVEQPSKHVRQPAL